MESFKVTDIEKKYKDKIFNWVSVIQAVYLFNYLHYLKVKCFNAHANDCTFKYNQSLTNENLNNHLIKWLTITEPSYS